MATIQDIADEIGISKAAVSRILNNKGSFNQATIEKVFQTAKRLDYKISGNFSAFEEQDFKIIAAVFPLVENPYYSILSSLLEQAAHSYGYSLMICSSLFDKEKEEECISRLRNKKINGIIYGSFTEGISLNEEDHLPIVSIGKKMSRHVPVVQTDNYAAGLIAGRHLIGKNCRKLLYISGYHAGRQTDERYQGFQEEAKKSGVDVYPYFTGVDERMNDVPSIITQMLLAHPDADGIFAETLTLAIQCIKVCHHLGLNIPQQMKVVGYGNAYLSSYSYPEISFVRENTKQIAQQAIALLVDLIENPSSALDDKAMIQIVPVSFEQKQTT